MLLIETNRKRLISPYFCVTVP